MNDSANDIRRIVALGASNMTRAIHVIAAGARNAWGPDIEIVAAHGLGRSFGAARSVHFRRLPGILECGLWRDLEKMPQVPTRAAIGDVGNDILFDYPPELIIQWVGECVRRLKRFTDDIALATLPMENIRSITRHKFLFFRSILFPFSRMRFEETIAAAESVERGLGEMITSMGIRQVRPRPDWYGYDPIHILPRHWSSAWGEILGISCEIEWRWSDAVRMYPMKPERRWILGRELFKTQTGARLRNGVRMWLY